MKRNRASGTCKDDSKRSNIYVTRIPQREERENRKKIFFKEVMAENLPNLVTDKIYRCKNFSKCPAA